MRSYRAFGRLRFWLGTAVLGTCLSAWAQDPPATDAQPPSAQSILGEAFARRYGIDFTSSIELVMRNRSGQELRRRFRAASKTIDGRVHSLGRLIWPEYLRGMAILTIEAEHRGHDAFLYLPSLDKVRRVTTAQRGDSFLGSDVTYQDLERMKADEFDVASLTFTSEGAETAYLIEGRPRRDFNYETVAFVIAESDLAILEMRYFKRGQDEPYRVTSASRDGIVARDGYVFPTHLLVENRSRGTTTEVWFRELQLNPVIDDHVFSVVALEQERKIAAPQ